MTEERKYSMLNERGSAIAIVMLLLAVVSLLGAGLMVQSRLDGRITLAEKIHDKKFNLADGAVDLAFSALKYVDSGEFSGKPMAYEEWGTNAELKLGMPSWDDSRGSWTARNLLRDYSTDPQAVAGWELGAGEGYHAEYWISQGIGTNARQWRQATNYKKTAKIANGGSTFACTANHTSGTASEPGEGTSWTASWEVVGPDQSTIHVPAIRISRN
jgi:PilX N-terminal